ncbi:MAG: prephenate dehydrogenase [uncultured bacterium]|nr:MAG: prephenate dehydrogenase [uncultured bacterium]
MKIGIIGQGRFGSLLTKHLSTDNEIFTFGPGAAADKKTPEQIVQCDLLIFAVPNRVLELVIVEYKKFIQPHTIVMDVGSIKVLPCQILQKHFQANFLGTHPLFGPDSASVSWQDKKMVFCRLNISDEAYATVQQLFCQRGVVIFEITPEYHDQMMANTQMLVHFIGRVLEGIEPHDISTPDYEKLLAMMERVKHDTYELFYDMQNLNPFAAAVRGNFSRKVLQLQYDITQHTATPLGLPELRQQIDEIDESIVALIGQRFAVVKQVGERKRLDNITIQDPKRETELFLRLNKLAQTYNVPVEIVTHVYDFLMSEARKQQAK